MDALKHRVTRDVLVTGGSGLVGRSLVETLVESGRRVRLLSRVASPPGQFGISVCVGDLTTGEGLLDAVRGCSAVFHCAGEKRSVALMEGVNVEGTRTLFDIAARTGVDLFCHLSSVGVIGRTSRALVDEATPCQPMTAYERSKLAAEQVVSTGLPGGRVVILRPTNVFDGAALAALLDRSPGARLRWLLKGRECSHFVYVKDVAAAGVHFLDAPALAPVETYIVSSDEEPRVTFREVEAMAAAARSGAPRRLSAALPPSVPYWLRRLRHGSTNRGDIVYSSRKLRAAGFRAPYGIEGGVRDLMAQRVPGI